MVSKKGGTQRGAEDSPKRATLKYKNYSPDPLSETKVINKL